MSGDPVAGRSPFSVLNHPQYRLLFLGTAFAMVAFGMMNVVQGVVAYELTGRNGAVGFVSLGQGIAMLFLSPVGGALSDRVSKRRMLLLAQGCIGLMFGVISALIFTGLITIWLLAFCTLILGCMFAMMGPTRQAWIGDLLTGPQLAHGVALQQLMMNATRIIGPLIAGLLLSISIIGTGGVYLTMTTIFVMVVAVLALMEPTKPRPNPRKTSIFGDLKAGMNYIWSTHDVRLLTLTFGGVVLTGFSYQTILPGYLENELGHPASQLGIIFGTMAVGGIITTVVLSSRRTLSPEYFTYAFGAALAGSLVLLALAPSFIAALAVSAIVGATSSGFQMLNNVNLMQRSSPEFFGRVMSVTMMAFGLMSMVAFPIGLIADALGERTTLAGLGVACFGVIAAGFFASKGVLAERPTVRASEGLKGR